MQLILTAGNVVSATVSTGAQTFTFTNPPADTGIAGSFTLFLTNGGSQTVNWPGSVDWAGGDAHFPDIFRRRRSYLYDSGCRNYMVRIRSRIRYGLMGDR